MQNAVGIKGKMLTVAGQFLLLPSQPLNAKGCTGRKTASFFIVERIEKSEEMILWGGGGWGRGWWIHESSCEKEITFR